MGLRGEQGETEYGNLNKLLTPPGPKSGLERGSAGVILAAGWGIIILQSTLFDS